MKPAGFDHAKGILSTAYLKDPTDPQWKTDSAHKTWLSFMKKYYPDGDTTSAFPVYGYAVAETMAYRACGLNLLVNAIILWNTIYLSRAVRFVREQGVDIQDRLLAQVGSEA